MDFGFSEDQLALQDLAKKIFRGLAPVESLPAVEAEDDRFHRTLWDGLAKAEMLGVALPEAVGGGGLGFIELCLLLEQAGDAACPVPLVPTLVMAAMPIAEFGTPAQQAQLLSPVVAGESVLTAALESGIAQPVTMTPEGDGWRLSGARDCVPALHLADHVLVPATDKNGQCRVFIVDTAADGVSLSRQVATNDEPLGRIELDGFRASASDVLGGESAAEPNGHDIVRWTTQHTQLAHAALQLGITRRALIMTAQYSAEREQFNRPIGTFQAVAQRAGDAYIDVEVLRLALWRAAWLLAEGREATREVTVAKIFASEASHRVVLAAQHIHGGLGFDRDYPLYRYFLLNKRLEFCLGSASSHVANLGRMIARGEGLAGEA